MKAGREWRASVETVKGIEYTELDLWGLGKNSAKDGR